MPSPLPSSSSLGAPDVERLSGAGLQRGAVVARGALD